MMILISTLAGVILIGSIGFAQPYYYQTKSTGPVDAKIERFNLRTQAWETFISDYPRGLGTVCDPTQTWVFAKYRGGMTVLRSNDTSQAFDFGPVNEVLGAVFSPQQNRFYITWHADDDTSTLSAVYDATTFIPIDTLVGIEFSFRDAVSDDGSDIYSWRFNSVFDCLEVTQFSTTTNTLVRRILLTEIGPPTDVKGVETIRGELALIGYNYPSRSRQDQHYFTYDLDSNSQHIPILFPLRSEGFLSPDAQYIVLERVNFDTTRPTAEYRPGNVSIYESRTGRLIRDLQLPPEGKILLFDNHPDTLYYYVPATNSVVYVDLREQVVRANVKAYLQGPYVSAGDSMATLLKTSGYLAFHFPGRSIPALAVDSIAVEVRDSTTAPASTVVQSAPAWLLSNGTIRSFSDTTNSYVEFGSVQAGDYYIVVSHRNHLAIMSAAKQSLNTTTPAVYDFTSSQSQAYGVNPMKQVGSKYAMYAGDADGNGGVGASDIVNERGAVGQIGYLITDVDLNGGVGASDLVISRANIGQMSQAQSLVSGPSGRYALTFEVRMVEQLRGKTDSVDIEIRRIGSESFVLGTASFVLNYNTAALNTPTKVGVNDGPWDANTDPDYRDVAMVSNAAGFASLIIEFSGGDDESGLTVPTAFTRVGTLKFPVKGTNLKRNFSWRAVGVGTQVFRLTSPGIPGGGQTPITPRGSFLPTN